MKRLFLDTSNKYLYIALFDNEQELIKVLLVGNNNHSETLVEKLSETLKQISITPSDVDEIYVGRGPGSYTGVRVACTVAKVMAYTLNIPLYSFSSLDLIYTSSLTDEAIKIKMDARRGFSYAKVLALKNGLVSEILPEAYIETEQLDSLYPVKCLSIDDYNYQPLLLLKYQLVTRIQDIHSFVPTYLRSGV